MKERIAILSIAANGVLAGGKIAIGVFSGSAAVLAAGLDSFADVFSSIISYAGIKISGKPADKDHPYGHYKFEVLGGIIITIIILVTGVGIIYDAVKNFFQPQAVHIGYLAFVVMIISAAGNEIMARLKNFYGKKENSISLLSDAVHSRVDVWVSLVILAGLFLTRYWPHADSALAALVGLYIVREAFLIGKEAAGSLLDVSAGDEVENKIREIAKAENISISELKTQKKGSITTANMQINLPSNLQLEEATRISDDLREKLVRDVDNLQYVVIQITSHDVERSFYKPSFGKSFGWQKKGKFKDDIDVAAAQGPDGKCVCPKCGYTVSHERGVPCATITCPNCDINLGRN